MTISTCKWPEDIDDVLEERELTIEAYKDYRDTVFYNQDKKIKRAI